MSLDNIVPFLQAPTALTPETMKIIATAFGAAEEELRASRRLSARGRDGLARTIIELAEHGLRCPTLLRTAALARFRQAA